MRSTIMLFSLSVQFPCYFCFYILSITVFASVQRLLTLLANIRVLKEVNMTPVPMADLTDRYNITTFGTAPSDAFHVSQSSFHIKYSTRAISCQATTERVRRGFYESKICFYKSEVLKKVREAGRKDKAPTSPTARGR